MIEVYTGSCGSGKTYHAVTEILRYLSKERYAIGNVPIHVNEKYQKYYEYREVYDITIDYLIQKSEEIQKSIGKPLKEDEILLVIDEAQLVFNCREWNVQGRKEWTKFFQLHRKLGYHIILVTQYGKMLDKQIMGVIEYEVLHRKAGNFGFKGKLVTWLNGTNCLFVAVKMWSCLKERVGVEFLPLYKTVAGVYDTRQLYEKS